MLVFALVFVISDEKVGPAGDAAAVPHQFSISNFKLSPFGITVFWARMALAMKRIASVFIYGFLRSGQT
jgi:hypothetical protein